jgi:hypothetical protein
VRRCQWLGQHREAGKEQRRIQQRLRQRLAILTEPRCRECHRKISEEIDTDHVEALHLAHDDEPADQNEWRQRQIPTRPPGRGLIQRERADGNADRDRIENMSVTYRKYEFRGDGHERRQDEARDAGQIGCCCRRQDQRQDERRYIKGFRVGWHA